MSIVRMQAVRISTLDGTDYPTVGSMYLNPGVSEFVLNDGRRREVGVAVYDVANSAKCWIMRQGYLRNVDLGNTQVVSGDVIWANDTGLPTLTRPPATKTRVKLGVVYKGNSFGCGGEGGDWCPDASVFVDVRVYPPLGDASGVDLDSVAPQVREVLTVVDGGGGVLIFQNKPIRRSVGTYTADFTVSIDEYLSRVDATAGLVVATLPPAATSADVVVNVKKIDSSANHVRIDGNGAELIDDSETFDLILQGESLQMQCNGTGWAVI
jgi:hypothetical protein